MTSAIRVWGIRQRHAVVLASLLVFGIIIGLGIAGCQQLGLGYVGTDTCLTCHTGRLALDKRDFVGGPHMGIGCEGCHGPGYAHVRSGGRYGLPIDDAEAICNQCHARQETEFKLSVHAQEGVLGCVDCHDPHIAANTSRPFLDNQLCLQCHAHLEFPTQADITAHSFHDYDPAGTGQSRCIACHMVPGQRANQAEGPHDHSLMPAPPIRSNQAPPPALPNSCAGITGCHDGSVITAPVFNVDDPDINVLLQTLYDARYGA